MDDAQISGRVRLTVVANEPLGRLAEQRLMQENIPCLLRSLGGGGGVWQVGTNLPHALYVKAADEMRARQVLDLDPAEIIERERPLSRPAYHLSTTVVIMLIIAVAVLLFGPVERAINELIR